jgi:predicted transcriptional regulator YdeE
MADIYVIKDDIRVACVKALSFPEGIGGAWAKLFSSLPSQEGRKLYGISYGGENAKITYMAAVEELHEGEADQLGLDTFVIRKGEYVSEFLPDWRSDETQIAKTFGKLLKDPRIDRKEGYCLEMYLNSKDVLCLVKLDPSNT